MSHRSTNSSSSAAAAAAREFLRCARAERDLPDACRRAGVDEEATGAVAGEVATEVRGAARAAPAGGVHADAEAGTDGDGAADDGVAEAAA